MTHGIYYLFTNNLVINSHIRINFVHSLTCLHDITRMQSMLTTDLWEVNMGNNIGTLLTDAMVHYVGDLQIDIKAIYRYMPSRVKACIYQNEDLSYIIILNKRNDLEITKNYLKKVIEYIKNTHVMA